MRKLLLIALLAAGLIAGCVPKISQGDYLATSDAIKVSSALTKEAAPSPTPKPTRYPSQRDTIDLECDYQMAKLLVDSGLVVVWDDFTRAEKRTLISEIPGGSGTVGEYLRACIFEGWTGYY